MGYLLITPIKDEEKHLSQLKKTVLAQAVRPLVWVIVDSGSTDSSYSIAKTIFENIDWVHIIKQKAFFEMGYGHLNFAQAINEGFEYLDFFASKNNIDYSFIGKTDATPILENNYFEELLREMENNSQLAIACGKQILYVSDSKKIVANPIHGIKNTAFNDIRLYRKDFLENMGGYPLSYSPDTVLLIKASNDKWKYKICTNTSFSKNRVGGSKIGKWKGFKLKGKGMHYLGYHPLLVSMNTLYAIFVFPRCYQAFAMLIGYGSCIINKEKKIDDEAIIDYFWNKRLKEVFNFQIND